MVNHQKTEQVWNDEPVKHPSIKYEKTPEQRGSMVAESNESTYKDILSDIWSAYRMEKRKEDKPILVILDIKMPKMDGFELYRELKKKDSVVKVCFLTASEMYYEKYRKDEYDSMDKDLFIAMPIVSNEARVERINKMLTSGS